jgi:preprotein translocase subunit SecY
MTVSLRINTNKRRRRLKQRSFVLIINSINQLFQSTWCETSKEEREEKKELRQKDWKGGKIGKLQLVTNLEESPHSYMSFSQSINKIIIIGLCFCFYQFYISSHRASINTTNNFLNRSNIVSSKRKWKNTNYFSFLWVST